jgi:hypothetical protein
MGMLHLSSSGKIVARVMRDFKPTNNGWQVDAIEWIHDALNEMQLKGNYVPYCREICVKEYRAKIPCNVEYLIEVVHNGMRLPKSNATIPIEAAYAAFADLAKLDVSAERFQVNPDFLHFPFEHGTVLLYYWGFPIDGLGYPMVMDDALIQRAISWYILYMYLLRGGTHPTVNWKEAYQMWENERPRAKNRAKRVSFKDMEAYKERHLTMIPSLNAEIDYYTFMQYYEDGGSSEFSSQVNNT